MIWYNNLLPLLPPSILYFYWILQSLFILSLWPTASWYSVLRPHNTATSFSSHQARYFLLSAFSYLLPAHFLPTNIPYLLSTGINDWYKLSNLTSIINSLPGVYVCTQEANAASAHPLLHTRPTPACFLLPTSSCLLSPAYFLLPTFSCLLSPAYFSYPYYLVLSCTI